MTEEARRAAKEQTRAEVAQRLQERREHHRRRNRPHRVGIVVAGFVITLAGVVMTGPVPGPGILVIPIGLALLALEFAWAERLLEPALVRAEAGRRKAAEASRTQKILGAVATALAIVAATTAILLWDIPLLPV